VREYSRSCRRRFAIAATRIPGHGSRADGQGGDGGRRAGAASRIAAETSADTLATGVDVRSADAIVAWHQATVERFGGVDLLVVNAGGPPAGASLGFDDAAWQGAFELLVLLTCTRT
jgi:3-oxoacyl-[acyl-carrier protein] reductase